MVRIKHRYLLLNFLYPGKQTATGHQHALSQEASRAPMTIQFRCPSSDQLNVRLLLRIIRDGVAELFGDYGSGMISSSLQVKYLSTATSTAIVRVSRAHYRLVWAALSFVTRIPKPVDQACVIQITRISGTIKKSEEAAIRMARLVIVRARTAKDPPRPHGSALSDARMLEDHDDSLDMTKGIEDSDQEDDGDD